MRLYFLGNHLASPAQKLFYEKCFNFLARSRVAVVSNIFKDSVREFISSIDPADSTRFILDRVDGIIVDEAAPHSDVAYLVALSISRGKPILYLATKGEDVPKQMAELAAEPRISKFFKIKYSTLKTVENILRYFIENTVSKVNTDTPQIKFTLRLTGKLDRYLDWKARKNKMAKADLVRQILDQHMHFDQFFPGG